MLVGRCSSELSGRELQRRQKVLSRRYALDGHGYIFSCTVIIFYPQVSLTPGTEALVSGHAPLERNSVTIWVTK
jgi:hypothetical protein